MPEATCRGWTLETLERYLSSQVGALAQRVDAALLCSERAITKAEAATEKRFDAANEFRAALQDQASSLMPRGEYDVQHKALDARMTVLRNELTSLQGGLAGKAAGISGVGALVIGGATVLNVLITASVFFLHAAR